MTGLAPAKLEGVTPVALVRAGVARTSAVILCATLSAALVSPAQAQAQPPTAQELVARAGVYAADFVTRFSGVVAEERYSQQSGSVRRELVSDFLIVQVPGTDGEWTSFRDVFEVDGELVRDRDQRLVQLFLEPPSASVLERADAIALEGGRYSLRNLGPLDNPLLALAFVQDRYRGRFEWSDAEQDAEVGPGVWSVRFEENARPTLITGPDDRDVPITGTIWIDRSSGQVLRAELLADMGGQRVPIASSQTPARNGLATRNAPFERLVRNQVEITTIYRFDAEFGIAVPVEMQERFTGATTIRTDATYGRFRRFSVTTTESFTDPP